MIITKLHGGLGNQLFQYAIGRQLAIRNSSELKLDISPFRDYKLHKYAIHHFNVNATLATESEVAAYRALRNPPLGSRAFAALSRFFHSLTGQPACVTPTALIHAHRSRRYVVEGPLIFQPQIPDLPDNTYLDGYWQDERYFRDIASTIRHEFTVNTPPTPENVDLAQMIASVESVSVHVRRADYVTNPSTMAFHGVCRQSYYATCVSSVLHRVPNAHFFVFSDDPAWAKAHLALGGPATFVSANNADSNYEDLRLMSLCHHHITANSSFSWWGAWLNTRPDKIVLCPENWLVNKQSGLQEIAPPAWERVANGDERTGPS